MLARWESFNIVDATAEAMIENDQQVLTLNKAQLYNAGLKNDNDIAGLYRSVGYALEKNRMNPKPGYGVVDLKLTGQFYSQFYLKVSNDSYEIGSTDSKAEALVKRYSPLIFGLTPESRLKAWQDFLRAAVVKSLAEHTGCKIS